MVNINSAFPSKYLSANDIGDEPALATMTGISTVTMQDGEHKMALHFAGYDRPLVLNKTNAKNIAAFAGPETDDWVGRQVVLMTALVDFQGQSVEAIRVRAPKNKAPQAANAARPISGGPPPGHPAAFNDEPGI